MKASEHGKRAPVVLMSAAYRDEGEAKGIPFLEWVETRYDPAALEREFRPHFWSVLINDVILRRE